MTKPISLFALMVTCVTIAAPLYGQDKNARHGVWFGLGVGPGSTQTDCASCTAKRVNGPTGYVRVGGTLRKSVLLGVQLSALSITVFGVDQAFGAATFEVFWYPRPEGAWYLRGGLGGMFFTHDNGTIKTTDTGPVLSAGTGYEFRMGRRFSIVPFVNGYASGNVARSVNGLKTALLEDTKHDMVQFGVGLTLH